MILGLKLFGLIVGIWAAVKLSGLVIDWLKYGIDELKPNKFK